MATNRTFNKTGDGNIEVFEDGKRVSTTTEKNARETLGYTGELTLPDTATNPTLPQGNEESNPLLTFKDTISKITDLARNKRNKTSLEFMMPFQGTTAASDFSSILGNLNRASERFTTEATERLLPDEQTNIRSQVIDIDGRKHLIDLNTGELLKDLGKATSSTSKTIQKSVVKETAQSIIDNNADMLDSELKQLLLFSDLKLTATQINSLMANRVSNNDLTFEAEELMADMLDDITGGFKGFFTNRESEIATAREKAIADIRKGGVIEIDGKEINLTLEIQEKIIAFINAASGDKISEILKNR